MSCNGILVMLAALLATSSGSPEVAPPVIVTWHGDGVQVYACVRQHSQDRWVFERPEATLTDASGRVRGHHGMGPSWTASDGSIVVGVPLVTLPARTPNSVPWVGLRASAHSGRGTLDSALYILRTDTVGGMAPAAGCDAAHVGAQARSPYQASYSFLLADSADKGVAPSAAVPSPPNRVLRRPMPESPEK